MIDETISRIEERLRSARTVTPEQRSELESLLQQLREEARAMPPNSPLHSTSAEPQVHEQDLQSTVSRLESALAGFENSHPQLTGVVNRISAMLANMGI